ncbi:HET-domain-containing protein [Daldinia eschscholtzii]|nr:HET-domain-containing protein [Daldinia eschscholtzii]
MECGICNKFKGKWTIKSRLDPTNPRRPNRNHTNPSFTWNELEQSAKSCYCCHIILSGCRGCFQQHRISEQDILEASLRFCYPCWIETKDEDHADKELVFYMVDGGRFEIEIFATEDEDCPIPDEWDYIPVSQRVPPRTDSSETLVKIENWISECIATHDFCDSSEIPQLPKRVVDVDSDSKIIRLVEPGDVRSKYLCLSHCWGLEQIITTTTETLGDRKKAIAWKELSKTFQDAIIITRALGFKFIWIDSLCIIQNDLRDWEIESAKMASIYSNAQITIAATHSANGHGGLFSTHRDFQVSGRTPKGEDYYLYFRERIDHHLEVADRYTMGHSTATHHPLLTRAWVYQERMLSTRVVHFGWYEVFFECKADIECECEGIAFHGSSTAPIALMKVEHTHALDDFDYGQLTEREVSYQLARLWRTMVCSYTALLLSKSKDRLPAIGGLARDMASRRKLRYLAGLWEETLNDDLLWRVMARKGKKFRPHPPNAPTWSWASVETTVLYWDEILFSHPEGSSILEERPPYEHFSRIERCEVERTSVDEFGSISHGVLIISGLLVKGILHRQRCPKSNECFERLGVSYLSKQPPPIDPISEIFRDATEERVTIV